MSELLDQNGLFSVLIQIVREQTGAEEASLYLLDEPGGKIYLHATYQAQGGVDCTLRLAGDDPLLDQVVGTGKPALLSGEASDQASNPALAGQRAYLPLKTQEGVIGALVVGFGQDGCSFQGQPELLPPALTAFAAQAIQSARRYQQAESERHQLELVLMALGDIVIILDMQERFILANHAARKAFGLGEGDLTGKFAWDLLPHFDLINAARESRDKPLRIDIELENGRACVAQLDWIPDIGLAIVLQDITRFKELDRIKSEFVSTVSHDLRSPLTAILGYVELIARTGPITPQQQEFIRRVQISVKNITHLINNLLDLGRIEAGLDTQREFVSVAAVLGSVVEGLQPQFDRKKHHFRLELVDPLPPILANPIRLRQLFDNLIQNAIKYTPEGGEITVRVQVEGEQIIFQVQDSGIGIPLADQSHIFDKLYRASNVSFDDAGSGLGLSIVKSIVDNHHGRIWVESTPGKGSTFTVVLPIS